MKRCLVIGAHFDDAELGCGGTMAKLIAEGKEVYKLTLTDNVTKFIQMGIDVSYNTSKEDSKKACEVLGVTEILDFVPVECNHLEYSAHLMQRIESVIFEKKIDTVFIHHSSDMNQDHVAAAKLCMTAARHCENIFAYQSNGYIIENQFNPTVFFDVSDYYDKKRDSLYCYQGDHDRFNRLFETSLKKTYIWGYGNKVQYAEGFIAIKMLIKDKDNG